MKKNIVIVTLIAVILILGGSLLYLNMNKDKTGCKSACQKESSKAIEKETTLKNRTIIQSLELQRVGGNVLISKEGDAYIKFSNQEYWMDESQKETIKKALTNLESQYKNYKINGYSNTCGDEEEKDDTFTGIKLPINNVVAAYEGYTGQGDYQGTYIYFVKADGTVSGFDMGITIFEKNGQINFQNNIDNLTNIATIVQTETTTGCSGEKEVMAIEKDGTQHILNNK